MADKWTWALLDEADQLLTTLTTMQSDGQIALNLDSTIRGSGSFKMIGDLDYDIDWLTVRLRPTHTDVNTGESTPWGVYIPVVPTTTYSAVGRSWSGTLVDKTSILDASGPDQTYVVPAGTPIVERVCAIIVEQADNRIAATPSEATTSNAITFDISDSPSWLTICNTLLESAAYSAVYTDRTGQWRVEPYVLPELRGVEYEFRRGEAGVHLPDFNVTRDDYNVPNVVTCVTQGSGDEEPLVAVARNDNPESRYSTVRRGKEIIKRYSNVEATDQAALYAQAQSYLVANSRPGTSIDMSHLIKPLWLGSAVRFIDREVSVLATVNEMRIHTKPGQLVESKLSEVISL